MFAAIYRWGLIAGRAAEFEEGWRRGTIAISAELGGWGSRLHRTGEQDYFAYALWPDQAAWRRAVEAGMPHSDAEARKLYRGAIAPGAFEVVCGGNARIDLLKEPDAVAGCFAAAYRWRLRPGHEASFEEGWRRGSIAIVAAYGAFGSRLHRSDDGAYFAYALWPAERAWREAFDAGMPHDDNEARQMSRAAVAEDGFAVLCGGEVRIDLLTRPVS